MKYDRAFIVSALCALSQAAPVLETQKTPARSLRGREVPQEHSHNVFLASVRTSLATNNPDNIGDPVFGLLGNAAAAAGQGSISDPDCLHQATADQAFTNAKAAGDVDGMTGALIYAALERNTGKVGLASVTCTAIKAKNPEIAAISQHQDPASPNAAAINKAITLELARQIASVGGDPQQALKSGTFAPGDVNDPTAKGNSCDTEDDEPGCIFTQNLLVEDATGDEIDAAVAGASLPSNTSTTVSATTILPSPLEISISSQPSSAAPTATTPAQGTATQTNIQTFTGSLGGLPPPVLKNDNNGADRPFSVNGATFVNAGAALQRSCAIQHNACADAANGGALAGGVGQCDTQEQACNAAAASTT
ncbi:MAG: hypothetical protein LQ351_005086 [Letrouitia transgressa]|nr:MAG: hypothetical protein LQ351_005086 [Letrouitia transgressa]